MSIGTTWRLNLERKYKRFGGAYGRVRETNQRYGKTVGGEAEGIIRERRGTEKTANRGEEQNGDKSTAFDKSQRRYSALRQNVL